MARIVGRRVLIAVLVLFAVSLVVFAASLVLPGREAGTERLAALPVRYVRWIRDLCTGSLGDSLTDGRSVAALIVVRATNSAVLVFLSALVATPVALLAGCLTSWRRGAADGASSAPRPVLTAVPQFVLGIVAILLFSTTVLHWLPSATPVNPGGSVWSYPRAFVLPVVTLVLGVLPYTAQRMRVAVGEVMESTYVQQARLRGATRGTVLRRYVAPNAIGPVAHVAVLQLAWLAGALVIVEYLFAYPGIGKALVEAVGSHDLATLQALVMVVVAAYLSLHVLADVLRAVVSPELRGVSK